MPFRIQPVHEFLVRPALPEQLSRMPELACNILWAWEPLIRALFRRLDANLWRECNYNPVLMLGRVSRAALQRTAADPRYLALYNMACQRYDAHDEAPGRIGSRVSMVFNESHNSNRHSDRH